ncbi:MAG: hypothetical protein ACRETR_05160 [Steroidobacteraceae bacterium]
MILDCARARTGALGALRLWICGFGAALALALAGCSTNQNVNNGTPVVTVNSQAAGDFSAYVIGISLYSMTRSDGYVAYPAGYTAEEFADLSQRVDLTELLNAVGVPSGTYTSVVIGLDYSIPIVYLKGQTAAATVQAVGGTVDPGIIYVSVKLDPAHQLVVSQNKSTPFALDFDLAASNSVAAATNTVTVQPFAVATATPTDTEQVRARGLFVVADTTNNNFIENIRPFEDNIYSTVGALKVNTSPSTYYNVNGSVYTGASGLAAVAKLTSNTPMVAYGSLADMSTITPALTATEVYAGTAVSNGVFEHVRGTVSAISGNTITLTDATYLFYAGYCTNNICFTYFPTGTVTISSTTLVTQDGVSASSVSPQAISVGSQIDAVGVGTNTTTSVALNATTGLIRLQSTPIWGTLNSGTVGSATLNVLSMGPVAASALTFAGTGTSSANDAVAANYTIGTGTADESAVTAGTLLRADGFPTAFGSAPPDFSATAVTPATSEPADLIVQWSSGSGTTAPFTSYDSTSLALNLANATTAVVVVGPQCESGQGCSPGTPLTGTPAITITGANQFGIGNATNGVSVFSSPSDFATSLTSTLNGSTAVFGVVAIGSYDPATNTFTASRVDVSLE